MRKRTLNLALFSAIFLYCALFLSHHTTAQTNIYIGDTSNVSIAFETIDGVKDTVYFLKYNKKRHGTAILYYDEALKFKAMECSYRRGKHQGADWYYYPDGSLKKSAEVEEGWFSDSIFNITNDSTRAFSHVNTYWAKLNCGEYNFWHPDGQIKAQGNFKRHGTSESIERGQWYFWFADGNVKKVVTYDENGLKNGVYKEFYKNGHPKFNGTYHADVENRRSYKHDIWKVYDYEGNLIREFRYLLGMRVAEE